MTPVATITRTVPLVLGWCIAWWLLWRLACPPSVREPVGRVSVIVPARNEAGNLPRLLASLVPAPDEQGRGEREVIVVDDHSTDGTADVARAAGVRVVAAPPLPDGWTGKTWACATGAAAATHRRLVFLDADTVLEPGGLDAIVGEQARCGGLVSVQPYHRPVRAYERLAGLFNVIGVMGVGCATAPPRARTVGAFGPCLATDRAAYDAAGGHAAVRAAVLEDVALAKRYAAAGLPVHAFGGRGVIGYRMYPEGPGQFVEGFTKNFAAGAGAIPWWRLALIFVWVTGLILAAWMLPAAALAWWFGAGAPAATAVVAYLAYSAQLAVLLHRVGRFGPWAPLLFPVLVLAFLVVFARSVLHASRGSTTWRGRRIPTHGVRT